MIDSRALKTAWLFNMLPPPFALLLLNWLKTYTNHHWQLNKNQWTEFLRSSKLYAELLLVNMEYEGEGSQKQHLAFNISYWDYAVAFIEFCVAHPDVEARNIFSLTLDWLTQQKNESPGLVSLIYKVFFENAEEKAREYIEKNQPRLEETHPQSLISIHLVIFGNKLSQQANKASILPLMPFYFDDPFQFTALLLLLLQEQVSPEIILSSHTLHQFLTYNLWNLGEEDSVVKKVYELLASNRTSSVKELLNAAKKTACEQRGFPDLSLAGEPINAQFTKETVLENPIAPEYTPTLRNFNNLHQTFSNVFLEQIISMPWNNELSSFMRNFFNEYAPAVAQIPNLISFICRQNEGDKAQLLTKLAAILQRNTIIKTMAKDSRIIHLAPYQPLVVGYISTQGLNKHIATIYASVNDLYEQLAQLMSLFLFLYQQQIFTRHYLQDKILEVALYRAEQALLGNDLIRSIRSCHIDYNKLSEEASRINNALSQEIAKLPASPLKYSDYCHIENLWKAEFLKIRVLQKLAFCIFPFFPQDIYSLKNLIVASCLEKQQENFDLTHTIDAIAEGFTEEAPRQNDRAKVFFETIFHSSKEIFQAQSLDYLESCGWLANKDNQGLLEFKLEEAVKKQMLLPGQLLRFLDLSKSKISRTLKPLFLLYTATHIRPLAYFLQKENISSEMVSIILEQTWALKEFYEVEQICTLQGENKPSRESIDSILLAAATIGHFNVLTAISQLKTNRPSEEAVTKAIIVIKNWPIILAFYQAFPLPAECIHTLLHRLLQEAPKYVNYFFSSHGHNQLTPEAVQQIFMLAVQKKELSFLEILHRFKGSFINNDLASRALNETSDEFIALWLCQTFQPCQESINHALVRSAVLGQATLATHLSLLTTPNKPSAPVVAKALIITAQNNHLHVVKALCKMTGDNSPDQEAYSMALEATTDWNCVNCLLSKKLNQKSIDALLIRAVHAGKQALVEKIGLIKKPSIEALKSARAQTQSPEILAFLRLLLGSLKNFKPAFFKPPENSKPEQAAVLKISMS